MPNIRLILPDQLSHGISSLVDVDSSDIIVMLELMEEASYIQHHPKKIAFIWAAMRHFAEELKGKGLHVFYVSIDDPNNRGSFKNEINRIKNLLDISRIIMTEPSEYRLLTLFKELQKSMDIEFELRSDTRFLCPIDEFKVWAKNRKQLRMEYFYREMRKKYKILIDPDGQPTGARWNFDKENRKAPPKGLTSPARIHHPKDQITKDVLKTVAKLFSHHFGTLEPFYYAVTREQALLELNHFINDLLPYFGDYQDVMLTNEPYLYHSLLSSYLNVGLLQPLEICKLAEGAYLDGKAKLSSVEGFIRQILGWREYVRGVYWLFMPEYASMNYLNATLNMPEFYWTANTNMFCVAEAVQHTREHAYSHHIQRLMITGNFALLAGLDPKQVQKWYLEVYSDAFEWVEMPNTLGMALFGDGGIMASKPYAASGKYIARMSNFCENCRYNPNETTTEDACPFNSLYWDFMSRNEKKLKNNQRLPYVFANWARFGAKKQKDIKDKAKFILQKMLDGSL